MRTVVLMRHGRTAWNAEQRIQGQLDPPLDEVGLAQGAAVAPEIAKLDPSVLWSSDLQRARQTADLVGQAAGLTPSYDARLREMSVGEREGLTYQEYIDQYPEEFVRFRAGDRDQIPGAEVAADVAARTTAALSELIDSLGSCETGVAVSHGAAVRIATAALLGWPLERARDLRGPGNCGWVVLGERSNGGWAMEAYNRIAAG